MPPRPASRKAASLTFEGVLKPLNLRTNWSAAARTSLSVAGGSKLNKVLMLRHMILLPGQLLWLASLNIVRNTVGSRCCRTLRSSPALFLPDRTFVRAGAEIQTVSAIAGHRSAQGV